MLVVSATGVWVLCSIIVWVLSFITQSIVDHPETSRYSLLALLPAALLFPMTFLREAPLPTAPQHRVARVPQLIVTVAVLLLISLGVPALVVDREKPIARNLLEDKGEETGQPQKETQREDRIVSTLPWQPNSSGYVRRFHKRRAKEFEEKKNFDLARKEYDEVIEKYPDAELYKLRGDCYKKLERWKEAGEDYSRSVKITPDAWVYYLLGLCHFNHREYGQTIKDLQESLKLNPKNIFAIGEIRHIFLAQTYLERRNPEDFAAVIKLCTDIIDRTLPGDPDEAQLLRGDAYLNRKPDPDSEMAIKDYGTVIDRLNQFPVPHPIPDLAKAYWKRSLAYRKTKNKQLAEEDEKKALAIDEAQLSRGDTYLNQQPKPDITAALKEYGDVIEKIARASRGDSDSCQSLLETIARSQESREPAIGRG